MRIVVLTSLEETNLYINRYYDEKDIVYPTNANLFEILIKNQIQYINLSSFIEEGLHIIKKLESEELIKKVINDLNDYSNKLYVFNDQFEINIGDRIAQLILEKISMVPAIQVEELTENAIILFSEIKTANSELFATYLPRIRQLSAYKTGEKPGLPPRSKFKYMDLVGK